MFDAQTWNVILILLVVAVGVYALYQHYKKGEVINLGTVTTELEAAIPFAQELSEVAQIVVNEIEQAAREGAYIPNEEKLSIAIDRVKNWSPAFKDLETPKVITAIKSAVLVASSITNQISASKAEVATAENKGIPVDGSQKA